MNYVYMVIVTVEPLHNDVYSDANKTGRWTQKHVDQIVCWITKAPLGLAASATALAADRTIRFRSVAFLVC